MIATKEDLQKYLHIENGLYHPPTGIKKIIYSFRNDNNYLRWKLVKQLRVQEYCFNNRNRNILFRLKFEIETRKLNKLELKLGIEINGASFQEGLMIYHTNGTVVNGDARIGKNCKLHGSNVIGNMGTDLGVPTIGDNVRLGAGAKVLGNVRIADNVKIGAGAVVLHDCLEEGALLIGIPAEIHRSNK